jgi:hypothetical protein
MKHYEDLPSGSKAISGGQTERETDDLISLFSFLESRKNDSCFYYLNVYFID